MPNSGAPTRSHAAELSSAMHRPRRRCCIANVNLHRLRIVDQRILEGECGSEQVAAALVNDPTSSCSTSSVRRRFERAVLIGMP